MSALLLKSLQLSLPLAALALPTTEESPLVTAIHPIGPPLEEFRWYSWDNLTIPEVTIMSQDDLMHHHQQRSTEQPPFQPGSAASSRRWVNGVENRAQYNDKSYPYAAMGKLVFPSGHCTASLVGPRHVATARHCYFANQPYVFRPSYNGGDVFPSASATSVYLSSPQSSSSSSSSNSADCATQDDWAIFVLGERDRLGDAHGYLGVRVPQPADAGRAQFLSYGYPADLGGGERPYRQTGVTATRIGGCGRNRDGATHTDLDCSTGQSGSSLFVMGPGGAYSYGVLGTAYVVGNTVTDSVFAGGVAFVDGVRYVRRNWP